MTRQARGPDRISLLQPGTLKRRVRLAQAKTQELIYHGGSGCGLGTDPNPGSLFPAGCLRRESKHEPAPSAGRLARDDAEIDPHPPFGPGEPLRGRSREEKVI